MNVESHHLMQQFRHKCKLVVASQGRRILRPFIVHYVQVGLILNPNGCLCQAVFIYTVGRRYSSHVTLQRLPPPLAPKPTVFMKNDINSFCSYPNYNQKLLIRFFMKSLHFLAKPEKRVFMPRPVNKASHQVPN